MIGAALRGLLVLALSVATTPRQGRIDGTPLLDLKPDRALFTPIAPPQPGDFQVGET